MESMTRTPGPTAPWRLVDGYQVRNGHVHDELITPGGELRPHYDRFVRSLETLGRHELASRWENAKRAIRDNGVTYNVYGDPEGVDRPWTLDMIPLLVPSAEWQRIEAALIQRARVLNLLLGDLYGPQQLLRERQLPPSLIFGNPGFLRPCHGIVVPRGIHLHLHAVDLARSADGQWQVLADRTQAPSGAGYALENRIVLSRSLPEAFRDCQVQRLASFFWAQRDTLTALAGVQRDTPRVVLLTPGPLNETYFEHAYLARYLGFTLVEGGDLTVRDHRVFIKTLDGLQPVDVIFRRLDDSYCDPLELRTDSTLGVAGLVEAARAGNVTIANALGSGAIETAALSRFLPSLCRSLLGEDLLLPSVPTRWCGDADDLQYVLEHLDRMVIKRTFPHASGQPVFGRLLSTLQRSALVAEIRANPDQFVGQEEMPLSMAPAWLGQKLEPRPLVLRLYVAAAGDSYAVMPGGLTRIAAHADVPIVSMQRGGGSKDTWVLTDGPVSPMSLLASPAIKIQRERRSGDLPSRVADNLFWLGRYAERVEHSVRVLRSVVAVDRRFERSDLRAHRVAAGARLARPVAGRSSWTPDRARAGAAGSVVALQAEFRYTPGRDARRVTAHCLERAGPPLDRHVAHSQSAPPGLPSSPWARPARRSASAAQSDDYRPGSLQRHGDGEHDARARLALPRHRPSPRARGQHDDTVESVADEWVATAGDAWTSPRDRRQHDDVSAPILRRAAADARSRSAGCRSDECALAGVSSRAARRSRQPVAAR